MEIALEKARRHAISAVSVKGAYHVGSVGVYPLDAARRGFIAQVWCNGHGVARVAPWGGLDARLSTNPIAIAVPTPTEPVLVDITTSVVAEGKVRMARDSGKPIPEGWVLDAKGAPTTDPAALYAGGTLLPLGGREGHRDTGYPCSSRPPRRRPLRRGSRPDDPRGQAGSFIQLVWGGLGPRAEFLAQVEAFLGYVRSARPAPGVPGSCFPGEPEALIERERLGTGFRSPSRSGPRQPPSRGAWGGAPASHGRERGGRSP